MQYLPHLTSALLATAALTLSADTHAYCEEAIAAPIAPEDHPSTGLVHGVWSRVYGSFAALTGRATDLVVLDASAKKSDGSPFPASAFICPSQVGQTPRLYVTWPLIARAQSDKLYDTDFVALVIGHELGHRARDLTFEGQRETKDGDPSIEARADAHGAFFSAVAGYSTRRLACDAALDTFLDVEAHVAQSVRAERRKKLAEALVAFDVWESLYESSAGLAFWDSELASRLLTWVDDRLGQALTPIPEFKVLLALTLLMDVAGDAPWTRQVAVAGAPNNHLRCVPVFPQHTALWDEVLSTNEGKANTDRDSAADIRRAITLLNDALGLGASPLAAYSGLACAHAYYADPDPKVDSAKKARAALEQARAYAKDRPPAVIAALDANQAFIDWIAWMRTTSRPKHDTPDADKKRFAAALTSQRATWSAHPSLAAWIDAMKSYPAPPPMPKKPALTCKVEPAKVGPETGWSRLPTCPDAPRAGGCPCGWLALHHLDDPLTPADPNDGVRTCVPGGWGTGLRWVDVHLPLSDIKTRMMLVDALDGGPLTSLRTWQKRCRAFEDRGTSDRGQRVFAGVCPDLGAPRVILQADDCRVRRAVVIGP